MPNVNLVKGNPAGARTERVVVTGLGVISCIGSGRQSFWEGLFAGHSGITPVAAPGGFSPEAQIPSLA